MIFPSLLFSIPQPQTPPKKATSHFLNRSPVSLDGNGHL